MQRVVVVGLACCLGCTEPLVDGVFTEDEWAFAQTFRLDHLTPATCSDCASAQAGHRLFFDPRLSGPILATGETALGEIGEEGRVSCTNCHNPDAWFADARSIPRGTSLGTNWSKRNTLGLVNATYLAPLSWSGQYADLVDVFDLPVGSKAALNSSPDRVAAVIRDHYAGLVDVFGPLQTAGDDELYRRAALALASFEEQLVSGPAPFDRYLAGELDAIDDLAKRGLSVFMGRGLCSECHTGPLFTDQHFYNTSVGQSGPHVPVEDRGRADITGDPGDEAAFRTPSLRHVEKTAPYMHTGAFATLADVIDFYRWGGHSGGFAGAKDERMVPLEIDDDDARALEAFLLALTGEPVASRWTSPPTLP